MPHKKLAAPVVPHRIFGTAPVLTYQVDEAASPGNVLSSLAALLLQIAAREATEGKPVSEEGAHA